MTGRARAFREKRRAKAKLRPRELVLIVSEGSKTEPIYLNGAKQLLRLHTASVEVVGLGQSPSSVVDFAIDRFEKSREFDRVYCVFDRDDHQDYFKAIDRCRQTKRKNADGKVVKFSAITSWPCFEYWLILHYLDTDAPFAPSGGKTAAQNAVARLSGLMGGYTKGQAGVFERLQGSLTEAAARAWRYETNGLEDPHSKIFRLVAFLASLTSRNDLPWIPDMLSLGVDCEELDAADR